MLLVCLAVLCLALTVPAAADNIAYSNGSLNGQYHAWPINSGSVISDSFTLHSAFGGLVIRVTGFQFWVWTLPGDSPNTVTWSITSQPNGGTIYASRTAQLASYFVWTNRLGYSVYRVNIPPMPTVNLPPGTYWLNLTNGTTTQRRIMYWDENDGPSQAFQNTVTPIGSESFLVWSLCPYCQP